MDQSKSWKISFNYIDEDRLLKINRNIKFINIETIFTKLNHNKDSEKNMALVYCGFIELYEPQNILWMKKYVHTLASFEPVIVPQNDPWILNFALDTLSLMMQIVSNIVLDNSKN